MNSPGLSLRTFAATDRGITRIENEDSFLLHDPPDDQARSEKGVLAIVADGVGGAACGKVASEMAVNLMRDHYYFSTGTGSPLNDLSESMAVANRGILSKSAHDLSYKGMATTCTALLLLGYQGFIAHVGDSRAYLFRRGELHQVTNDHTLVNKMVEDGLITAEAAKTHPQRNIITKSLGSNQVIEPDIYQLSLEGNDIILLCSDGLCGMVSDKDIVSIISGQSLPDAGNLLIETANKNGGHDNITVVLLQLSSINSSKMNSTRPFAPVKITQSKAKIAFAVSLAILSILLIFYCWSIPAK